LYSKFFLKFYTHILRKRHTKLYKHMSEREKRKKRNKNAHNQLLSTSIFLIIILNNTHTHTYFSTEEMSFFFSNYLQIHRCVLLFQKTNKSKITARRKNNKLKETNKIYPYVCVCASSQTRILYEQ